MVIGSKFIFERHGREFKFAFHKRVEAEQLAASGESPDGEMVEIVEIADHLWFLGC